MPDSPQSWRGKATDPPPRAARPGGWRADAAPDPKRTGRKVLAALLGLGCVAAVAAMVWLFLLPTPPKVPTVVVVAATPTAAAIDRLDVPPDVYGWLGAKSLAAWTEKAAKSHKDAKTAPKVLAADGQPYPLADPNWAWVDALAADDKADPVVVYIGAHGTVDNDGDPALYTGGVEPDGKPGMRKLKDVVEKLAAGKLEKKKKLLILDPGRTPPNPAIGELAPLFVSRLKEIESSPEKAFVGKCPNLVLVCASGPGERSWESERFGQPIFSEKLQDGLTGKAAPENRSTYTAWQLFEYVKAETEKWTRARRPSAQTPVLFPLTDGRARAEAMTVGITLGEAEAETSVKPPPSLAGLAERWAKCQELLDQNPARPPYAYTPRLWRRYRDLLLRYDGLVRAGQEQAPFTRDLADKIDKLRDRIDALNLVELPASLPYSYALPVAVGNTTAIGPDASALLLEAATTTDSPTRPAALLARMMTARYRDPKAPPNAPIPLPSAAPQMISTRLAAEQAALGLYGGKPGPGAPYAERLWPVIAPAVRAADSFRREAEDRLFGPAKSNGEDSHAKAAELFQKLDESYAVIQRHFADPLRHAYRVSDRVLADLPYLTMWAAETDEATLVAAGKAWEKAHKLAADLEVVSKDPRKADSEKLRQLKAAADAVDGDCQALKAQADKVVNSISSATNPANWPMTEALLALPPPLLTATDRAGLLAKAQTYLQAFDSEKGEQGFGGTGKVEPKVAAARRAMAGSVTLPAVASGLSPQTGFGVEWEREAVQAGHTLRDSFQDLANRSKLGVSADEAAAKSDADRTSADRFSRLAVPFALASDEPEPAVEVRNSRWKVLLEGLALSAAQDHWYDADEKPYYKAAANAYLKDAERLRPVGYKLPSAVAELLALEPWAITSTHAGPVAWTTEQKRSFTFALDKKGWPKDLDGYPAARLGLDKEKSKTTPAGLLTVGKEFTAADRLLGPAEAALPAVPIAVSSPEAEGSGTGYVTADVYFRGQKPARGVVEIALYRKPEWTVSNVKPRAEEGAMLAVKSDDEVTGAISIVIDLSGSMKLLKKDAAGKYVVKDGKYVPDFDRKAEWRSTKALQTVIDLLDSFSETAYPSVSLFVFGEEAGQGTDAGMTATMPIKQLFPASGPPPERMTKADIDALKSAVRRLKQDAIPEYYTPLVPAVRKALAQGFPPGYTRPKTVLVLTDGMDTTFGEIQFDDQAGAKKSSEAEVERIVGAVRRSVQDFNAARVPIHLVFFDTDAKEEAVARRQFDAVSGFDAPGQLWSARDAKTLAEKLDLALRPKPRLLTQAGDAAAGVPPFGLPTNRPTDDPYKLRWYGKVVDGAVKPPADRYLLDLPGLGKQPVAFDPGDRLLVRIQRTAEGARFSRGVYFRDYEIKPDRAAATVKRQAENGDWLLAVPGNQIQLDAARQDLSLVVGLESLQGLTPGETGLIKQVRPEFVWWEISQNAAPKLGREVTGTRPGYGRADNLSGYPTPAWHLTVKDWPRAAGGDAGYAEPRLRAWPLLSLSGLNPDPVAAKRLTLAVPAAGEVAGTIPDRSGGSFSVRVAHEEAKVRSTTRKEPEIAAMKCAVVRIDHPPGREVFARATITRKDGSTVPVTVDEHRYFRQANAVTAYVGPLDDRDVEAGVQIAIELVSVPDLKRAVKDQFVLDALGPPRRDFDLRLEQPQPQRDVEFSPGR